MAYRRNPAAFLLWLSRNFGDISHFKVGRHHMYLLNRPDFIQDVLVTSHSGYVKGRVLQRAKMLLGEGLVTSEGEFHLNQRRMLQPAFHRDRLLQYTVTMVECAAAAQSRWSAGETRDMLEKMTRLTLAIVGKTLFSVDVENEAAAVGRALTDVQGAFDLMMLPFSGLLQHLPIPTVWRINRARRFLDATIYKMITERRRTGLDNGDLLSMLLLATDEDGTGSGMPDRQVRDEAMTLFLAGHETTANALTWTWYLLSRHPEVEARFHEELRTVLAGRAPTFADIPNLRYTEMVLSESMRLYPPAWAIGRRAIQEMRIFNYVVPKNSICLLCPYTMHRHERYWPDPERFDPERFSPEGKQDRPRFAYFPFGGGPRVCIGERFAWMEGVLVLATIGQKWRFRLAPGQVVRHAAPPHTQAPLRNANADRAFPSLSRRLLIGCSGPDTRLAVFVLDYDRCMDHFT